MPPMLYGKEHVKRYQETDGKEGYDWEKGTTILLLHTTGRKSGKERIHPLIFREWTGDYLIVASKGGDDDARTGTRTPGEPGGRGPDQGRQVPRQGPHRDAGEKPAMWQHMVEAWPDYSDYQKKTSRNIPVVVLERT